MTTERAGLEQQRRDGCQRLPRRPTVRNLGLQRRENNPHKGTKVAIWDNRELAESAMYQMSVSGNASTVLLVVTTENSAVDPDPVGSAPFCRKQGLPIWIRIRTVPYLIQPNIKLN